jgi:hypothetical protein
MPRAPTDQGIEPPSFLSASLPLDRFAATLIDRAISLT